MSTTVFITQFWKNATPESVLRWLQAFCLCAWLAHASLAAAADITELRAERSDEGVFLSASIRFELSPVVEDALLKGIAIFFVVEADIYRDRWYWTDRRVTSAARTIRLAYQPLTRRWRVNIVPGIINSSSGLRATLNQNYDSLPEALSAIQRIGRWKIADAAEVEAEIQHHLEFYFRLDLSQLPRPFQIGMAGQRDWTIEAEARQRLQFEPRKLLKPEPAGKEAAQEIPK